MFPRTLKAHKLKINTQVGMTKRRAGDDDGGFLSLHACAYAELPHHSYAMKTFIWQNRLAPALEQRIFASFRRSWRWNWWWCGQAGRRGDGVASCKVVSIARLQWRSKRNKLEWATSCVPCQRRLCGCCCCCLRRGLQLIVNFF